MIHLIFVTKYRKKDWNNLKLHCKIAPKGGGASLSNLWNWRHLQKVTQYSKYSFTLLSNFNPHLPCGRWRGYIWCELQHGDISIHTFLAEGDWIGFLWCRGASDFNPHLPCGRWRKDFCRLRGSDVISIHTFLAEGDTRSLKKNPPYLDFNPHLPCGRWLRVPQLLKQR